MWWITPKTLLPSLPLYWSVHLQHTPHGPQSPLSHGPSFMEKNTHSLSRSLISTFQINWNEQLSVCSTVIAEAIQNRYVCVTYFCWSVGFWMIVFSPSIMCCFNWWDSIPTKRHQRTVRNIRQHNYIPRSLLGFIALNKHYISKL